MPAERLTMSKIKMAMFSLNKRSAPCWGAIRRGVSFKCPQHCLR
jgi:hypothetical protein